MHRDIKPANILITPEGEPRIIDLGIARFLDDTSLTHSLAGIGPATPIYAAPEQLLNKKSMIGVRTDFFLLALLSLELVLGHHPFDPVHVGGSGTLVDNILTGKHVPPPPGCRGELRQFIAKNLDPQPYNRLRTANDVLRFMDVERNAC